LGHGEDIAIIKETLPYYAEATGARVNIQKSKALALGSWDKSRSIMNIQYCEEITILGFHMKNTTKASTSKSWDLLTTRIRANAQEAYLRGMSMDYRIRYVREYLLATVWYTTQIYPPPDAILRQLNTSISWFVWQGVIFRVPLSTLQKPNDEGGWRLNNPAAKCPALIIYRLREQEIRKGTITADCMKYWGLHEQTKNPHTTRGHRKHWSTSTNTIWNRHM
jgi:hypothetical protein